MFLALLLASAPPQLGWRCVAEDKDLADMGLESSPIEYRRVGQELLEKIIPLYPGDVAEFHYRVVTDDGVGLIAVLALNEGRPDHPKEAAAEILVISERDGRFAKTTVSSLPSPTSDVDRGHCVSF